MNLAELTIGELLSLSRGALTELRRREVLRTGNAPAGDYAEWLVRIATDGQLAPNSQTSWDIVTSDDDRLQVKARMVTNPRDRGQRQFSAFRSWNFDAAVIVLFDDTFRVWKAARIDAEILRGAASFTEYVNAYRVLATDDLLALGEDWVPRLHAVETHPDRARG